LVIVIALSSVMPRCVQAGTVAVLAALDRELEALKKEVDLVGQPLDLEGRAVYQVRFGGHPVLLVKTGANADAVRPLIRWLVEDRHVDAVMSIGPAGALSSRFAIDDVVVAHRAVQDSKVSPQAALALAEITDCEAKSAGTVVTVTAFVADHGERVRLRNTYDADLVDMSAAVIARECASHHVPCIILRQITDRADEGAPRSFAQSVHARPLLTIPAALCVLGRLTDKSPL
jgi:adenosylhomocysteine nucleosidase